MLWTIANCIGWKFVLGLIIGIILILCFISWSSGKSYEFLGLNATKDDLRRINRLAGEQVTTTVAPDIVDETSVKNIDNTPSLPEDLFRKDKEKSPLDVKKKIVRGKTEQICREILEDIYGKPFPKCRPPFLKSGETGRCLEIDCYNEELKIGLEYNGIQHYSWPNYTGQTRKEFEEQLRRDKYKVDQCDLYGCYLVSVPYNVPSSKLREYIEYYLPENVLLRERNGKEK